MLLLYTIIILNIYNYIKKHKKICENKKKSVSLRAKTDLLCIKTSKKVSLRLR